MEIILVKPRKNETYYFIDDSFEGMIKISDSKWEEKDIDKLRYSEHNVFILYEDAVKILTEVKTQLKTKGITIE